MKTRCIAFLCILFLAGPYSALSAENDSPGTDVRVNYLSLGESIDQAALKEKELLANYSKELAQAKDRERMINSELAALKVQFSIYSNLLIVPDTQVKILEQAYSGNMSVRTGINTPLSDFKDKRDRVNAYLTQIEDQIRLNTDQLKGITADKNQNALSLKLGEKLKGLLDLLNKKKDILSKLAVIYDTYYKGYSEIDAQFGELSATFEREIKTRKKLDLFQRKKNVLFTKSPKQILEDMGAVLTLPRIFFTPAYWAQSLASIKGLEISSQVIMGLLFVFFQYALFKAYKGLCHLGSRPFFQNSTGSAISLSLIEKSLFLSGNILFLFICDYFFFIHLKFPVVVVIEQVLTTVLLSRWMIDALEFFIVLDKPFPGKYILSQTKRLVRISRYFALIYILSLWLLDTDNVVVAIMRIVFAALFYIGFFRLGKSLATSMDDLDLLPRLRYFLSFVPLGGYMLMFAGLIMDLSGYAQLALFMAVALGKTLVILIWSGLFFHALQDFKHLGQLPVQKESDEMTPPTLNAQWFLSLISTLIWLAISLVGVIYVWGGKQAVVQGVYTGYTTPIHVGHMSFSLMGFTVALVLLLITHGVARGWRELFQKRLLNNSGMDIGVQESITTISVYLIWIAGILMALNVFGMDMTSITVVLGALGIGLGFGLQNIFNNFLSGIILLFERPIQVGDDVEINGTWASVKKINVRSTVVQTYDNATLIIPNSDFISNQVTNWSFKDKRLRRNIVVGVAYGSDLELVRKSMVEAAEKTPRVLKLPKSDVLFKDFGDNALIFVLRIWTRVEYFYSVESAVRFEIDRLFRERNIEIAFPQMDLHLRSLESDLLFKHVDMTPAGKPQKTKKEVPAEP